MKLKLALIALGLVSAMGTAQKRAWTLEECVLYAEENNLSIAQFELDYESALIANSDAIGALLPSFNTSINSSGNTGLGKYWFGPRPNDEHLSDKYYFFCFREYRFRGHFI